MLPSQVGSGNGSASNRGTTGHCVGVAGVRPVLVRAGQGLPGVGDIAAGRQVDRDVIGMLGANGPGGPKGARPGNGTGLNPLQSAVQGNMVVGLNAGVVLPQGARFDPDREGAPLCSGSENDSDSADDDDPVGSLGDSRRGVKRERGEMEAAVTGQEVGVTPGGYGMVPGGVAGAKPGKKTRGRVKIKMEFIDNKLRRYTTFSKRKTGIMKKAYELSTLTGTQVLLLVASETGHVYTFATRKLQPMITSETGKALIQTCLNSPDSPPRSDPSTDQRMSATGFEETDLTYQVSESESMGDTKDTLKPALTVASLPGTTSSGQATVPTTSTTMQVTSGPSFTNYLAPVSASSNVSANGTVLKAAGASAGVMQLPSGFTFMPGAGIPQQLQAIQVHHNPQSSNSDNGPDISHTSTNSTATIVTSSVPTSVAGHMMYPSPHTVMYASTPALTDGGLAVLNAFSQGTSAMQVSHTQAQDGGGVPQVFLAAPPGTVQIPVSAVQLHPMVIGQQSSGSSSNLTELQVVNLDATQNSKSD
ncbi:serum response factor isoform X3 [Solea senegalensis]|uniref:Serum response factor n=1 Tax=Solea senegalensis TaxID=28829 RepID=A0AAV6S253_SOLSE|nr:serum response factor b isoform X5 [Solea senegalensis]KAG7511506.1 serum response factor isoform X3 [Solea senegalensis]